MRGRLQQLRDSVVNRGREVEVTPSGEVREPRRGDEPEESKSEQQRPTKLAPRTFGA